MLTTGDIELLARDILLDRTITSDLFCGHCGYSLYKLPQIGRCPECGTVYNARQLLMDNVVSSGMLELPLGDTITTAFLLIVSLVSLWIGAKFDVPWLLGLSGIALAFGLIYLRLTWPRFARFMRLRAAIKRVRDTRD